MKKYLHNLAIIAAVVTIVACSSVKKWSEKEREQLRSSIEKYREMVYLNNLSNLEFQLFADQMLLDAETAYPLYATLASMPALSDTIDIWVITAVATELDEDADNMRHIFPYSELVKEQILPEGLDHNQRKLFYKCLASNVDDTYNNMGAFINAILNSPNAGSEIKNMQQQCAENLFDWEVIITETEISE